MAINRDYIGREYRASATYEVGREHVRLFAEAIGDSNPAYTDPDAAKALGHPDCIAPPTFLTVLNFRFALEGPIVDVRYPDGTHGRSPSRSLRRVGSRRVPQAGHSRRTIYRRAK